MPYLICLFRVPAPLSKDHIILGLSVIKGAHLFIFFLIYETEIPIIFWKQLSLHLPYHDTQLSQLISFSSFVTECGSFVCYPLTYCPEYQTTSVQNSCPTQLMAPGTGPVHHCSPSLSCCFWGSCFGDSGCPSPLSKQHFPNVGNICLQNYIGLLYNLHLVVLSLLFSFRRYIF